MCRWTPACSVHKIGRLAGAVSLFCVSILPIEMNLRFIANSADILLVFFEVLKEILICRSSKVVSIETELKAAKETLQATNASFATTYLQVSSTMTAWESRMKELEQTLKDGMESWPLSTQNIEFQQERGNVRFEKLLQKHAELSQQVRHCIMSRAGHWSI